MLQYSKIYGLTIVFILLIKSNSYAQNYHIHLSDNPLHLKYIDNLDSIGSIQTLLRVRNNYLLNGYLEYNFDSIFWTKNLIEAFVHTGPIYKISKYNFDFDSLQLNNQMQKSFELGELYDSNKVANFSSSFLLNMENTGYPFCQIHAKYTVLNGQIEAFINIERGPLYVFDTLHIDGDAVVRKKFIEAYTGIRSGENYNEILFRKAHDKLQQLPFLFSERNPQLVFMKNGKAKPYYYLKKKKSDQLNGIIGLAPNPTTQNVSGTKNVVFTGEFTLKLNNLFKSAKVLNIQWKSFKARSQELKTYFSYPYLFYQPIGVDFALDLVKYDTMYTVLQRQVGFQYYTSGINGFKAFFKQSSCNLNTVDTTFIRNSKQFPSTNAVETKQYGLMANFTQLDYKFNPRKGYILDAFASVGIKQILRDNIISEVKFGAEQLNLYAFNTLRTNQYQYHVKFEIYQPLKSKSTLKLGFNCDQIIAPQIYFNELQREGGINSLKGFNEQSIFASNFNMLDIEYRYLLGLNSHIKIFWNGAYYEDKSFGKQNQVFDTPWGFGIGGNIETGAGILSLAYALGKQKGNNFDIRTGKFHFGISSYF